MPDADLLWIGSAVAIFGLFMFVFGFIFLKKRNLIQNTPTSKIRSLAMGFAEVYGEVVSAGNLLRGPLSNKDCVYYRYTVEEYRQSGKNKSWVTIEHRQEGAQFFVKDDTGTVLVDSIGAEVEIPMDLETYTKPSFFNMSLKIGGLGFSLGENKRRYREWRIEPKDMLYVLGNADDNPHVEEATASQNVTDIMIQKGGPMFYISDKSEKEVLKKFTWKVLGGLGGGSIMILGGLAIIFLYFGML